MMDDKSNWVGPFAEIAFPSGSVINYVEALDLVFPSGVVSIARPCAKIMLHPIMRNVYHIRNVEEATGLTAVARRGYVELVKL